MTLNWYVLLGELKGKNGCYEELAHIEIDTLAEAREKFRHDYGGMSYTARYQSVFIARFSTKVEKWAMK